MEKQFDNEALIVTLEHDKINSTILEQASDTAEKLTELDCVNNNITCYIVKWENEIQHITYTEEAQDMFNVYYDVQVEELYNLLNKQLKIIE
jgi:hypothetical protein